MGMYLFQKPRDIWQQYYNFLEKVLCCKTTCLRILLKWVFLTCLLDYSHLRQIALRAKANNPYPNTAKACISNELASANKISWLAETRCTLELCDALSWLPGLPFPHLFIFADRSRLPGWTAVIIFPASFVTRLQHVPQLCLMRSKGRSAENFRKSISQPTLKKPCGNCLGEHSLKHFLFYFRLQSSSSLSLLPAPWVLLPRNHCYVYSLCSVDQTNPNKIWSILVIHLWGQKSKHVASVSNSFLYITFLIQCCNFGQNWTSVLAKHIVRQYPCI